MRTCKCGNDLSFASDDVSECYACRPAGASWTTAVDKPTDLEAVRDVYMERHRTYSKPEASGWYVSNGRSRFSPGLTQGQIREIAFKATVSVSGEPSGSSLAQLIRDVHAALPDDAPDADVFLKAGGLVRVSLLEYVSQAQLAVIERVIRGVVPSRLDVEVRNLPAVHLDEEGTFRVRIESAERKPYRHGEHHLTRFTIAGREGVYAVATRVPGFDADVSHIALIESAIGEELRLTAKRVTTPQGRSFLCHSWGPVRGRK